MKKIALMFSIVLMTSCTTTQNLTDGAKDKMKNWGKNPCYDKETKVVKIGCNK